ncbi:MAG: hypothetical protein AB7G93_08300 [Bdellovibrionales bacterium]
MFVFVAALFFSLESAYSASAPSGMPRLPSGGSLGLQGSAGVGFVDYTVESPESDIEMDRGIFATVGIERAFNFMHLYLTLGLSHMTAEGTANYSYTNLSSSASYAASDVKFKSAVTDLSLGIKLKLIDDYWFRPYIEGGGLGGYHQVTYTSKQDLLTAQGSDYKSKDVVMGSGYYGEAGLETMFSEKFGVKLSARKSWYRTKNLETLGDRPLRFSSESYYFALLFGF